MRSAEEFDAAKQLIAAGLNDCAIARQIGVPRTTVRDWRRRPPILSRNLGAPCGIAHDFAQLPAAAYSYVLGMYLGDGSSQETAVSGGYGSRWTRSTQRSSTAVVRRSKS
jgi:hypothetical protein